MIGLTHAFLKKNQIQNDTLLNYIFIRNSIECADIGEEEA